MRYMVVCLFVFVHIVCVLTRKLLQVHLIFASMRDNTGNFVRKVMDAEGTDARENEEIFWSGFRHHFLARFYIFSHSLFFDPSNDSYSTVGKKISYNQYVRLSVCVSVSVTVPACLHAR